MHCEATWIMNIKKRHLLPTGLRNTNCNTNRFKIRFRAFPFFPNMTALREKTLLSKMGAVSFRVHYFISSDIWKIFTPFCSFSCLCYLLDPPFAFLPFMSGNRWNYLSHHNKRIAHNVFLLVLVLYYLTAVLAGSLYYGFHLGN